MSVSRRKFSKEFKTKVVLEALKERKTLESLAKKYELQPTQISLWKAQALKNFDNVFVKSGSRGKEENVDTEKLYATIGQQKVEIEFLKKKVAMRPLEDRRRLALEQERGISLAKRCALLSIHRSGIYYMPKPKSLEDLKIMRILDEQYLKTPFYGALKLVELLKRNNYTTRWMKLKID